MINFVKHKNIDKRKWDLCIKQSHNTILFVQSWYLDVVCPDWCALVLNDYEAVFPMALKSKLGIAYIYQPFFTRYFGLFSKNSGSDLINDFLNAIPEKIKYISSCLHETNQPGKAGNYSFTKKQFQVLDLNSSYEELQTHYSDNVKRNLKKAHKEKYTISEAINSNEVVELFKKTKGRELEVFRKKNYDDLLSLMKKCNSNEAGRTIGVIDKSGKVVAAAFFMGNNDRFIFLKSAVTDEGKKNGAMHFVFDHFIRKYAGQKTVLDFGGSSVETVARFYKSFGAKEIVYLQIKKNNLPFPLKFLKN